MALTSGELNLVVEIWTAMKPYIQAKEKLNAGDAFIELIDEFGINSVDDLLTLSETDTVLATAITSYHDDYEDADVDQEDEWEE